MSTINLGDKVKDRITGFVGIATSRHEFINGCVQYSVTPQVDKDGKYVNPEGFDEARLEVVEAMAAPIEAAATGGPQYYATSLGQR